MIARTASGLVTSQVWYVASIPEECRSARVRAISDALWSTADVSEGKCPGRDFAKPMPGSRDVLPKKTRRGIKGTRLRARWALIPVAPPDMTTTSPGLRFRLDESPKADGATCPSEVKTLPSR